MREKQERAQKEMEGKRRNATKSAIERFRSENPSFTDDYISELVERIYPNKFEDSLEVALEIVKELYRSHVNLTDDTFNELLQTWTEEGKWNGYDVETRKQWRSIENRRNLLNRIYVDARTKTVYLSQYEEFQDEGVRRYYEERCKDKDRTLAKQLFYDLNQMALDEAGELSGFILPFHCYSEPNGDVVFTKNKRTMADYNTQGKSIVSETDVENRLNGSNAMKSTTTSRGGCLSIVIFAIIVISLISIV